MRHGYECINYQCCSRRASVQHKLQNLVYTGVGIAARVQEMLISYGTMLKLVVRIGLCRYI